MLVECTGTDENIGDDNIVNDKVESNVQTAVSFLEHCMRLLLCCTPSLSTWQQDYRIRVDIKMYIMSQWHCFF